MKRLHLIIHGHVQGVFFRAFVHEHASRLKLTGWVRNNPDGTVEVVAEGPQDALETLLQDCRRGPPGAQVTTLETHWEKATGEFAMFKHA